MHKATMRGTFFLGAVIVAIIPSMAIPASSSAQLDGGCSSYNLSIGTLTITGTNWDATAGTWVYSFSCSCTFACSDGFESNCTICANSYAYKLINGVYVYQSQSPYTTSATYDCDALESTVWTYTFPAAGSGTLTAGDTWKSTFFIDDTCDGDGSELHSSSKVFTVPPAGP